MTLPVAAMMIRKNASVRPTYRCSFTSTGRTEVAVLIAPVLVRLSKQFAPSLTHDTTPARLRKRQLRLQNRPSASPLPGRKADPPHFPSQPLERLTDSCRENG